MYLVLGVLYESYIHPITILSTLPSAGVGALLALLITDTDLSLIAVIGIILLIGIVKKNAIMMIDFALDAERTEGLSPRDAIYKAALLRFRPILMTTLAALFGALPLMLSSGSGAEMRQPLGLVMVGGLLVSQVLTLFTTPAIYLFFDRLGHAWRTEPQPLAVKDVSGMSLSSPFISRPVATTLLSISVVLVGRARLHAAARLAAAAGGLPGHLGIGVAAGGEPGDDGLDGRHAARAGARDHRGCQRDHARRARRAPPASTSSSTSTRTSTPPRARCRRPSTRRARCCRVPCLGCRSYRKINPSQAPIMLLALTSDTASTSQLYDLASTVLAQKVAQVTGVGDVTVGGGSLPAVRVELQPQALTQYGISLDQVRQAIGSANLLRPKGIVEDGDRHWQIQASDQLTTAADYEPLVITYRNGAPVRLGDVATVYRRHRGPLQRRVLQRQGRPCCWSSAVRPTPTSSRRWTA